MAGMENIYDILAKENEESRQVGIDYSKIREGGVAAAVMAQAGGMLGGSVMQAAGFKTAAQKTQEGREQLQQRHPNPTTYQDMVAMANDAKNLGLSGDWELIMKRAEAMNSKDSTVDKKWSTVAENKRIDIRDEALNRGYRLTEQQINSIANTTPDVAKLHPQKATYVHPWMDSLNGLLGRIGKPNIANIPVDDTTDKDPAVASTPSSVSTDLSGKIQTEKDTKDLEGMNTQFTGETKNLKENISTIETGINIVNQVRNGNTAAMPQMERILAKFNSDKRISNPEVQQVMKIGGLGQRIANSISRFISGDTSVQTLNDIEEMLIRIGQLDQGKYNSKVDDYTSKYGERYDKDTLSKWIPPSTAQFFTTAQKLELARQELKRRGK